MQKLRIIEMDSLPRGLDLRRFIDSMLCSQFMLCHDLLLRRTFLATDDHAVPERLTGSVPGISFHDVDASSFPLSSPSYLVGYAEPHDDRDGAPLPLLDSMYRILSRARCRVIVSFAPAAKGHVERVTRQVEAMASRRSIRLTRNTGNRSGISSASDSLQMELFYDSDEKRMLLSLLETLNEASMRNGAAYRISVIIDGEAKEAAREYIASNLFLFEEKEMGAHSLDEAYAFAAGADALPFSHANSASFLSFSDAIARHDAISTQYRATDGEIEVGEYLSGSLTGSGEAVRLSARVFNLGTIISGLPGTGKTATAMGLVAQLAAKTEAKVLIVSPTGEWNALGRGLGARVIRLYESQERINFFRCDSGISIERFYENLAMLLASASDAGPYRNSMEKSLLSAFRKVYASTTAPDPAEAYAEIEEAVIEQHGKRSGAGVTYTKHGENVMAGLQSLRLMLLKPQFAYRDGASFSDLLRHGVVFDLSMVSNNMKRFFYALILNQAYSFTDALDELGNERLRVLLCIEEAQLMLGSDNESAATLDLEQRIQDFRKRGVGLMLIAHNVTDISVGIRRLCQIKAYFRQSADVARYACNDLVFSEEDAGAVVERLKSLPQGTCALSYMTVENGMRVPHGSVFVRLGMRTIEQQAAQRDDMPQPGPAVPAHPVTASKPTRITVLDNEGRPRRSARIGLVYAGEQVFSGATDQEGRIEVAGLMAERTYKLLVFGAKKRETVRFKVTGGTESTVGTDVITKPTI